MFQRRTLASLAVFSIVLQTVVCHMSGTTPFASTARTSDISSEVQKRSKEDIFFVYGAAAGMAGSLSLGAIVWFSRREIRRIQSRRKLSSEAETVEAIYELPCVKELRLTEQRQFQPSRSDDNLLTMTPAALANGLSLTSAPNNHYVSCYDLPAMRSSALHPWPLFASGPFCGRSEGGLEDSSHGSYENISDTDNYTPVYGNI